MGEGERGNTTHLITGYSKDQSQCNDNLKKVKKEKHELESNFKLSCTKMFKNRSLFLEKEPTTPSEVKSIPRLNPECLVDCFQWNHS